MHPAKGELAEVESAGIITQNDGCGELFSFDQRDPTRAFSDERHRCGVLFAGADAQFIQAGVETLFAVET